MKNNADKSFTQFLLNEQQQKAVIHESGPFLVAAGPGSGKTRIITGRILNLILNRNIPPSAIIALTFTNKAAHEMKERVASLLAPFSEQPFIGTFHSYCVRLLKKKYAQQQSTFSILNEDDQEKLIRTILKKNNLTDLLTPRRVKAQLSLEKQQLPTSPSTAVPSYMGSLITQVCHTYEQHKKVSNCFDFDDLLRETLDLFAKDPLFQENHQKMVRHVLVDEYQDTNKIQHELLKYMALKDLHFSIDSVCAVGDEDQSVYSWRGATIENFLNFKKDFCDTHLIKIEQNYRSVQPILALANQLIQHNQYRNTKTLWSLKEGKDRIRIISCATDLQEADSITSCIKTYISHNPNTKIGVLYRTHAQSRIIEESFIKHSIPYKIVGGTHFYDRKEIKDILAYLRLIVNPFDHPSLLRILNTPSRSLGEKCEEIIHNQWQTNPYIPFKEILTICLQENRSFTATQRKNLAQFISIFDEIDAQISPKKAIETILSRISYYEYLKAEYEDTDAQDREANIKELVEAAHQAEIEHSATLQTFLEDVSLLQEKVAASSDKKNYVLLMTKHAAKGLEFELVILPGLEEGVMPSGRALFNDESIEEERRLFYVGITRACEYLLITYARSRNTYGRSADQLPSRFLDEIIPQMDPHAITTFFRGHLYNDYFHQWINGTISSLTEKIIKTVNKNTSTLAADKQTTWRVGQLINHNQYGSGIIKGIEDRTNSDANLTILFKQGIKKIRSAFVKAITQ